MGGSWREIATYTVGWQEREKINRRKVLTEHTAGCWQNKRKTEWSQRRASQLRNSPSLARGRRQWGGERGKLGPRDGTPTKLQTGFQSLTKDFLRFWVADICREGRSKRPAPQNRHKTHPTGGNWGWDRGGEKVHRTRGECARQAPGSLSCSAEEGTKRRPNQVHAFVEYLKTGTARNAGPAPYRAARSLSSVDGESTHLWAGANPVWPDIASVPCTRQWYLSAAPHPPCSKTEPANQNKRPPLPACVRTAIRHWRDGKQKPNKQREPLQKGPVQQIKIPVGNTDYAGKGL